MSEQSQNQRDALAACLTVVVFSHPSVSFVVHVLIVKLWLCTPSSVAIL